MALPNYRLSIYKRLGNEAWSNDWLLNTIDIDAADSVAVALVEFEERMHSEEVQFEYYRVSSTAVGDRVFRHVPINQPGYVPLSAGNNLPLFNTMRVDLQTIDSDPCRKYFRTPVIEGNQENGKFTDAAMTYFTQVITTYLLNTIALDNIVSNKGNVVTTASVYPYVQMRQLARRRKKKVT